MEKSHTKVELHWATGSAERRVEDPGIARMIEYSGAHVVNGMEWTKRK